MVPPLDATPLTDKVKEGELAERACACGSGSPLALRVGEERALKEKAGAASQGASGPLVGIAVPAAVGAGIIGPDVTALGAAALSPRGKGFEGGAAVWKELIDELSINA